MTQKNFKLDGIDYVVIERRENNWHNCLALGVNTFSAPKWFTKAQMDNAVFSAPEGDKP